MIPQIGAATIGSAPSPKKPDSLGQDVFLDLLISQLKNQDPLEPMEGTEFVTQLAQFSELDEMRAFTSGQKDLQAYMASLNNFSSVSLLGKEVAFAGDQVAHQEGLPSEVRFDLSAEAALVTVKLYDSQGHLVRTIDKGPMTAGSHAVGWNGTNDTGAPLPSGTYRCEVAAKDASQGNIPVALKQQGVVQEVVFENGVPSVRVGERWIPLPEIQGIQMALAR